MWKIYFAFFCLLFQTLVQSQACKTWEDLCKDRCTRIADLSILISGCKDCVNKVCNLIRNSSESLCSKFAHTPCGKNLNPNCNDLGDVQEMFDCDFEEEESEDRDQQRPPPIPQTATQPNTPDDSDRTTVIVIAVCVSVVVVLIAFLITGVYCWRVRRQTKAKKQSEGIATRNKAFTNDSYIRGREIEQSRQDSTYNTINDLQIEHENRDLEQGKYGTYNDNAASSANDTKKDKKEKTNVDEYNRIKFNKSVIRNNDPSYSHLDTVDKESDYNSTGDKMSTSTTSGYQYGVPIKITDIDKLEAKHQKYGSAVDNSTETIEKIGETDSNSDVSFDTTDVSKVSNEKRNSFEAKPRAVVTPMVKDSRVLLPIPTKIKNASNQTGKNLETDEKTRIGETNLRNDDYEIAVVNEDSSEGKDGDYESEVPIVQISAYPKSMGIDDYEIAAIQKDVMCDSKSGNESPTPKVQIVENTKCVVKDDYEMAVVKNE